MGTLMVAELGCTASDSNILHPTVSVHPTNPEVPSRLPEPRACHGLREAPAACHVIMAKWLSSANTKPEPAAALRRGGSH